MYKCWLAGRFMSGWQDGIGGEDICQISLSLIPGSHMELEGENLLLKFVHGTCTHPQTLRINKRTSAIAQWSKALVTKLLTFTLGPTWWKERADPWQVL